MSLKGSSGGASGVTSIAAAPSAGAAGEEASGFFSEFDGGLLGGGAEDIVRDYVEKIRSLKK